MSTVRLARQIAKAIITPLILCLSSVVWSAQVTVAGFAFAGDFKSAAERFPYAYRLFRTQEADKNPSGTFSYSVIEKTKGVKNSELEYLPGTLVNLKNSDRALMAVLVMTGETVAIDDFGSYHKMFVNLRGDTLIFDYKSKTIVRSCPVSVVLFDASPTRPSEDRITGFVNDLIRREDGRGLITQATRCLERATLPREGTHTRTVQVRKGEVLPEALAMLPESLKKNPGTVNAMLTDSLASILSARLDISMLPSSIGHAVGGVMTLRLENGDDYMLKLEEGDFVFDITLNKLVKMKTAENNVGVSYVYGAYSSVRLYEPALNTTILGTDLKNGESAVVPSGQVAGDDFAAYQDAIRGLYLKLADAIKNPGSKWIGTAASAKNIETQLESVRTIIRESK
ncbi:MAG: hypothetical protein V5B36_05830 [Candidatus Accumulibacter sp. UW25]|jgi:hypothetical protein